MTVREVILNTSTGQLDVELSNNSSFEVNLGEVVVLTQDAGGNPVYRSGGDDIVFGAASGITVEQAVDGVAAALLAGTHSGVTVAYDDPNNKINLTVSGVAGAPQVNADWNATSGVAQILNKPTIPSAYTDEMAQDAVAAALIAGTHSGVTVAYDDTNNKINLTASGTGGAGLVKRKVNIVANSVTASVFLTGFGTQALLDAATVSVSADGCVVTVSNLPSTFILKAVNITYPDNFTTGTNFKVVFPSYMGATTVDSIPFPDMVFYNQLLIRQPNTNTGVGLSGSNTTIEKTGLTAGTGMTVKVVCV